MQRTFIFLAYFFICVNCFSQQYPFVHYTPKDGLVNSRVKKAYQDSKGRMYFLTYGGLSVYDGARFRNYTQQNGLAMDIINDILEIGNDSILIATNTNKLNLLVNGKIETFKIVNGAAPLVNQFYRHDDGRIYLSSDFGLYILENNKIHELNTSGILRSNGQPNLGKIAGIGNYLVISTNDMILNRGIYLYDIENNRICDSLISIIVYMMDKVGKNKIWVSTDRKLLIVDSVALRKGKLLLHPPGNGFQQAENYLAINKAFGKTFVWYIYGNKEFRNSELRRIDEEGNILSINLSGQMTVSYILNIFIDRENNIWLSNEGEGVFKIVRSPLQVIDKPLGLSDEGQPASAYYKDGTTWYSTVSKKLFRQSATGMKSFSFNLASSPVIFYSDVNKILGNDHQSIYEAYPDDRSAVINFKKIITLNDSDQFGRRLLVDPNGVIITSQVKGLAAWLNDKLIFFKPIDAWSEYIEELFIDKNNHLWMIKRDRGIEVFNIQTSNYSNYLQPLFKFTADQMPGSIRSCIMDKQGLIWMGTRNNGLAGYRLKENKLEKLFHFHTANGLSDNFITSLSCDSSNNIIAGTQTGVDRILYRSNNTYQIENLSKNSNLFSYILRTWADTMHAYAMTNSGVLYQIASANAEISTQSPSLLLEEIKVNAKTIGQITTIFSYKENNISFYVAAPSYIDEKQISYTYLLEGSGNSRWSDTTPVNSIVNLTNLSPGKYILKVKAFFPSHSYTSAELIYPFTVTPPWWQTWWFRSLLGLLIIALLITGFRFYYRRKLEKQMAVLEKKQAIEKERTRIATDMHDDLGAGLSRIKFLSETIGIKKQLQQPVDEEISSIRNYSHEMIDKMGEIVWALNEKNDTLSDLLSYTRSYAVEYLSQHGIQCTVDAPEQMHTGFVSGEFRRNIYLTIKEALHNIVKHSQASAVTIRIRITNHLYVEIQDNGIGFDKKDIRQFSNGLSNMQSRINEIKGEFKVENGEGTLVKINVPLFV